MKLMAMKRLTQILIAAFASTLAFASPPTVDKISPAAADHIDRAAQILLTQEHVPGAELAVLVKGEVVYECGYGYADPQNQRAPDPDTYFQINAVTQTMTAMAVLKLAEEGRLSLDDPISKYISVPNESWRQVSLRMLLTMSSGIRSASVMSGSYMKAVERVAHEQGNYGMGLDFQPGMGFVDSTVSYFLLGDVIASASGQPYIDYIKAQILDPLAMDHTGFLNFENLQDFAVPFIDGKPVKPREPFSGFSSGGVTSTIRDMEKFANGLFNRKILGPESYDAMWTPHTLLNGRVTDWGMGWNLIPARQDHFSRDATKDAGGFGWKAQIDYFMDKGITVIALANSQLNNMNGLCYAAAKSVAAG